VDRLYVPKCKGGSGLLLVEDTICHRQLSIKNYLVCSAEFFYKQYTSLCNIPFLWNPQQNLKLDISKNTLRHGRINLSMVNLPMKLQMPLMFRSNGDGYLVAIWINSVKALLWQPRIRLLPPIVLKLIYFISQVLLFVGYVANVWSHWITFTAAVVSLPNIKGYMKM